MRKEKELFCKKRAPAEAESRKVGIIADASRTKTLALANADASAIKVRIIWNRTRYYWQDGRTPFV